MLSFGVTVIVESGNKESATATVSTVAWPITAGDVAKHKAAITENRNNIVVFKLFLKSFFFNSVQSY